MESETARLVNGVGSLVARTLLVGLSVFTGLTAPGCAADAGGPTQVAAPQPCDRKIPTFPIRPRRTEGQDGTMVYVQTVTPILAAAPQSGHLCRYRDSDLAAFATLTPQQLEALPGILNPLPVAKPITCADAGAGLAFDLLRVVDSDGAQRRVVVGHDGCSGVMTDGQIRSSSADLLKWLDRILSDEGRLPLPATPPSTPSA